MEAVHAAYSTDAHLRVFLPSSSLPRRDHQSLRLVIFSLRHDKRSVLVGLSAKGKRLVDGFRERRTLLFREALGQLSETEYADVILAMKTVIKALESYEQKKSGKGGSQTSHD